MKNALIASLFAAFLSMNCAVSRAEGSITYEITALHATKQGIATPFLDKEVSMDVNFRRGSDAEVSQKLTADTDINGHAILTVDQDARPGFEYTGIELFCAKLDGPHYCNGVFATKDNSLNPTDDASQVHYDCSYSVAEAQPNVDGTISVVCTDK
jgi:hypothetical protein